MRSLKKQGLILFTVLVFLFIAGLETTLAQQTSTFEGSVAGITTGAFAKGIITVKTSARNGSVVGILQVSDEEDIILITAEGKILRFKVNTLREIGRNTQGVKLMDVEEPDRVVAVALLVENEKDVTGAGAES